MTELSTNISNTLSTLNQPYILPLIYASGVRLSTLFLGSMTPLKIKLVFATSFFLINIISVSMPGRLDGELAKEIETSKKTSKKISKKISKKTSNNKPLSPSPISIVGGRTLIAPAPWAFAIWGPIYISEFLLILLILSTSSTSPLFQTLQTVSPYWFLSNLSQALWCASFRTSYVLSPNPLSNISSPTYLTLTTLCLLKSHAVLVSSGSPWYITLPIALHGGWTSAASLVNINGALAYKLNSPTLQLLLGHLSLAAAVSLAAYVSSGGGGGTVPIVLSWALRSLGDGMRTRVKGKEGNLYGASSIGKIADLGSAITAGFGIWGIKMQRSDGVWGK
eukprot:CAMPEP_0118645714 /NCGR_PEP_ID=MMETSP0785-20121206/7653_1 /TAXON_ID=91992 /ORGANISM="Bolidomonas pacifica, Strain CCMP 1866" /LENGTH=335 /DNA_ID=CAMNT_0006537625 /DNA_START=261 /DNA_END=1265 /DNA_ORIENTATION=-